MENLEILQVVWYLMVGFFFMGYAVLDGFDLGIGILFPFVAKSDNDKRVLFDSIWPFWDGNEVWLIAGGAVFFAAFPHAYATVFSGFYLALILVLFALIFRAVSMEFWYYDLKRKSFWSFAFITGSLTASLLFGVALGNVILGVPLDNSMQYTGSFITLLRPYTLILGLLGLSAILMQGCTYAILKSDGSLNVRLKSFSLKAWYFYSALFLLSIVASYLYLPSSLADYLAWIPACIVLVSLFFIRKYILAGNEFRAFLMSSLSFIGLWCIAGIIHFPYLVKSNVDASQSITIYNGSSSELTLTVMLIIAIIGMPLVIGYTIYVYRIFRGKIRV